MHLTLIVLFFLRKHVALLTLIGMDRLLQRAPLVTGISANASTHSGKPVSSGRDIIFFSQTSFWNLALQVSPPRGESDHCGNRAAWHFPLVCTAGGSLTWTVLSFRARKLVLGSGALDVTYRATLFFQSHCVSCSVAFQGQILCNTVIKYA